MKRRLDTFLDYLKLRAIIKPGWCALCLGVVIFTHQEVHANPAIDPLEAFLSDLGQNQDVISHDDLQGVIPNDGLDSLSNKEPSQITKVDKQRQLMSDLVVTAMGYLGVPYHYGGNSVNSGFDCSGFVLSLYKAVVGKILPRTAAGQAQATKKIQKAELRPGDLVFFNTMRRKYSHVGVYVGDNKFIHAPRAGSRIRVESMAKAYWKHRFDGARRVVAGQY